MDTSTPFTHPPDGQYSSETRRLRAEVASLQEKLAEREQRIAELERVEDRQPAVVVQWGKDYDIREDVIAVLMERLAVLEQDTGRE